MIKHVKWRPFTYTAHLSLNVTSICAGLRSRVCKSNSATIHSRSQQVCKRCYIKNFLDHKSRALTFTTYIKTRQALDVCIRLQFVTRCLNGYRSFFDSVHRLLTNSASSDSFIQYRINLSSPLFISNSCWTLQLHHLKNPRQLRYENLMNDSTQDYLGSVVRMTRARKYRGTGTRCHEEITQNLAIRRAIPNYKKKIGYKFFAGSSLFPYMVVNVDARDGQRIVVLGNLRTPWAEKGTNDSIIQQLGVQEVSITSIIVAVFNQATITTWRN